MPSRTGQERLRYTIRLDAALARVDVALCPQGFRLARLNEPSPGAHRLLQGGQLRLGESTYAYSDEGVDLPASKDDQCLSYTVELPQRGDDPTSLRRVGGDLLASPDLWLWVPTPRPLGVKISALFLLPEGFRALLPWEQDSAGEWLVPESAFAWKAAGAFGRAAIAERTVGGAALSIGALGAGFEHGAEVQEWIWEGARTSAALFGMVPVKRALVLAVPTERSGAGFGMALRGGGPAIVILLDQRASAATLARDWTSTHEFLHLGVPRLPAEDAWLFEGLATYYTEVTRARAGLQSPAQAYQQLLEGFERGRHDASSHSLREESARMREQRSYHRVYWAGAALAFMTDVAARRAGGTTLDSALRSFAQCCATSEDDWTAERVLEQLDRSLGAPLFRDRAQRWLDSSVFPDVTPELRALGVAPGRGKAVFGPAPQAALRDAIMARNALPAEPHGKPEQAQ